jgi:hypothetical protein
VCPVNGCLVWESYEAQKYLRDLTAELLNAEDGDRGASKARFFVWFQIFLRSHYVLV